MRRILMLCALGVALMSATAGAVTKLGAGVFGGVNIPVVQDDAESGSLWGIRGYLDLTPALSVQPYLALPNNGDYDLESQTPGISPVTLDGGKYTVFGVDAALGSSAGAFSVQLLGGIGSYKLEHDTPGDTEDPGDFTRVGYSGGLGVTLGFGPSPIKAEGRATAVVIPLENGGSRKHIFLTAGVRYGF